MKLLFVSALLLSGCAIPHPAERLSQQEFDDQRRGLVSCSRVISVCNTTTGVATIKISPYVPLRGDPQ